MEKKFNLIFLFLLLGIVSSKQHIYTNSGQRNRGRGNGINRLIPQNKPNQHSKYLVKACKWYRRFMKWTLKYVYFHLAKTNRPVKLISIYS